MACAAMGLGWMVLVLLTAYALVAAVAIARRAGSTGRAELGVATMAAFVAVVVAPIFALGYTNHLTKWTLGIASPALDTVILVLCAGGRVSALRGQLRDDGAAIRGLVALPIDAIREAWRARSIVAFGLVFCLLSIAAAIVLTYLIAFNSWDGFFYHEPIVGYAIQNHGFSYVPLSPFFTVESTNGYPRLCESFSLWFCIFTDRTLIELPPALLSPALMVCVFALTRRYTDRVTAMGWAVVLFLVPHVWHGLCWTYIDNDVAFFAVVAMYYASRPVFRVRDAMMATLGMALVVASKGSGLLWVPPIALVAYSRLIVRSIRSRPWAVIGSVVGGTAAVSGVAALTLVRNWVKFKNPFWPMTFKVPRLHIDWPGIVTQAELFPKLPLQDVFTLTYGPPHGGIEDVVRRGYGSGVAWIVLPLGAVAIVIAAATLIREIVQWRRRGPVSNLWLVLFPGLVGIATTPSLEQPRYNIHIVVVFAVACAWLLRTRSWVRVREGFTAAAIVLSMLQFFWLEDAGDARLAPLPEVVNVLSHPFAPRAYTYFPSLDLLTKERFDEIGPGDRVAYDEHLEFVGALWNFDFSNRVDHIPFTSEHDYQLRIERYNPKWVCVGPGSEARTSLEKSGNWQYVGKLSSVYQDMVYRRAPPPSSALGASSVDGGAPPSTK